MKKALLLFFSAGLSVINICKSQSVAINNTGSVPHASALLDLESTNKGFLPPRLSWSQIKAISLPAEGLLVYDTDISRLRMFNGIEWVILTTQEKDFNEASGQFLASSQISGTQEIKPYQCVRDAEGNAIVLGSYTGTLNYGHYNFTAIKKDIFFAKYDKYGMLVWLRPMGGSEDDEGLDMEMDAAGNIYIAGYYKGLVDFNPHYDTVNAMAAATSLGFFAKYNANGQFTWVRSIGQGSQCQISSITLDEANSKIYFGGSFTGTGDFNYTGNSMLTLTAAGSYDIFFGSAGFDAQWNYVKAIGNAQLETIGDLYFHSNSLYLTGAFKLTLDFDPSPNTYNLMDNTFKGNGFLAKYNAADGVLSWAKKLVSTDGSILGKIAITASNTLAILGSFSTSVDIDMNAGTVSLYAFTDYDDLFVGFYTGAGSYLKSTVIKGTYWKSLTGIDADEEGNVFVSGMFADSLLLPTIDNPGTLIQSMSGSNDVFVCKIDQAAQCEWIEVFKGYNSEKDAVLACSPDGKSLSLAMISLSNAVKYPGGQMIYPKGRFIFATYLE